MRLTRPIEGRHLGQLHIFHEAQVMELDAAMTEDTDGNKINDDIDAPANMGNGNDNNTHNDTVSISQARLDAILSKMIIVVPCKDEDISVIRGVVAAIPASCLVIIVSNCDRPVASTMIKDVNNGSNIDDPYAQLVALARRFGTWGRQVLVAHQKDREAAAAFKAAGITELIGDDGLIRNGKGEGMLLGIALAAAFAGKDRKYIGFIDADNLYSTSVSEYCRVFAAGFAMGGHGNNSDEDTMVRLRWASKPKINNGRLEFVSEGRCSRIVNSWLNGLFSLSGFGGTNNSTEGSINANTNTPLISTGNAGEHSMTLSLAMELRMAAGYAIEPFHYIDLLSRGYLNNAQHIHDPETQLAPITKPVKIFQIRTLSPHFHRASDDGHIRRMWAAGLGSIYHGLAPFSKSIFPHRQNRQDSTAANGITAATTSTENHGTAISTSDGITSLRERIHSFATENHIRVVLENAANGTAKAKCFQTGILDSATGELPKPRVYPALSTMDVAKFRNMMVRAGTKSLLRGFRVPGLQQAHHQNQQPAFGSVMVTPAGQISSEGLVQISSY
jgi:mannosyl-3-phosphoglycerate synthase